MAATLRVLLVSSWGRACGIAEYAAHLKESVEAADPEITLVVDDETLDPESYAVKHHVLEDGVDLVHLNHHDALHSRWTVEHVRALEHRGIPVVLTYHDTRERLADCPKLAALSRVCASTIVHEPVEGLRAILWRQGVPAAARAGYVYGHVSPYETPAGYAFKAFEQQPVLGCAGFHFVWKNYDRLAQETARAGWAIVILANNATLEDEQRWRRLNRNALVVREFRDVRDVVAHLAACDATAFMYECANTGTSGAIRLGLAARKPVIALSTCRQFRDLVALDYPAEGDHEAAEMPRTGIHWIPTWESFPWELREIAPAAWDRDVAAFAQVESWNVRGRAHAELYRLLTGAR